METLGNEVGMVVGITFPLTFDLNFEFNFLLFFFALKAWCRPLPKKTIYPQVAVEKSIFVFDPGCPRVKSTGGYCLDRSFN